MISKVNHFTDEEKFKIVREYMDTGISQSQLMLKYNVRGSSNLYRWMIKFGLLDEYQGKKNGSSMDNTKPVTTDVKDLEARIRVLERDLERERLRSMALDTMIDVAEHELNIEIRKKHGAKR